MKPGMSVDMPKEHMANAVPLGVCSVSSTIAFTHISERNMFDFVYSFFPRLVFQEC